MKLLILLVLTSTSVWGLPDRKVLREKDVPRQTRQDLLQPHQVHRKDNTQREASRDCKPKSASCIAQKAAAEAKAAQAAQNAAGAQAAHMVSWLCLDIIVLCYYS